MFVGPIENDRPVERITAIAEKLSSHFSMRASTCCGEAMTGCGLRCTASEIYEEYVHGFFPDEVKQAEIIQATKSRQIPAWLGLQIFRVLGFDVSQLPKPKATAVPMPEVP